MSSPPRYIEADEALRLIEEAEARAMRIVSEYAQRMVQRLRALPPDAPYEAKLKIWIEETSRSRAEFDEAITRTDATIEAAGSAMH